MYFIKRLEQILEMNVYTRFVEPMHLNAEDISIGYSFLERRDEMPDDIRIFSHVNVLGRACIIRRDTVLYRIILPDRDTDEMPKILKVDNYPIDASITIIGMIESCFIPTQEIIEYAEKNAKLYRLKE